jgi:hypothetical protein
MCGLSRVFGVVPDMTIMPFRAMKRIGTVCAGNSDDADSSGYNSSGGTNNAPVLNVAIVPVVQAGGADCAG